MNRTNDTHRPFPWVDILVTAALLLVLAAVANWRFGLLDRLRTVRAEPLPTISIGGHVISVELAADDDTRRIGLSKRAHVPADQGMLFIYPAPQPGADMAFWMKGCWIDLDIAFISPQRRIVTVRTMKAEPPDRRDRELLRYGPDPGSEVQFALEMEAGEFSRLGIKAGDQVEFDPKVAAAIGSAR